MSSTDESKPFVQLNIAVLTISVHAGRSPMTSPARRWRTG